MLGFAENGMDGGIFQVFGNDGSEDGLNHGLFGHRKSGRVVPNRLWAEIDRDCIGLGPLMGLFMVFRLYASNYPILFSFHDSHNT